MDTVGFTRMADGTREDYALLDRRYRSEGPDPADTVLDMLKRMAGPTFGYRIDRYTHSLQCATRARRDGADEETVACAMLHDIGDVLAPDNHSQVAAAILRPYVGERDHWIVAHHGVFQGYYYVHHLGRDRNARDAFRGHPHFEACLRFCESWDQTSFDPDYDTMPLDAFEPMVRRLFAHPPQGYD